MGLLGFTPEAWHAAIRVVGTLPEHARSMIHITATPKANYRCKDTVNQRDTV